MPEWAHALKLSPMHSPLLAPRFFLPALFLALALPATAQVTYLDQNFDRIPEGMKGRYGEYDSHGRWFEFGTDGIRPEVQSKTAASGNAVRLTRTGNSPDQHLGANFAPAITGGKFTIEFKAYAEQKGGFSLSIGEKNIMVVNLWVSSDETSIRYYDASQEKWVITDKRLPAAEWTTFRAVVDLERGTWSASMGEKNPVELFKDRPVNPKAKPPFAQISISPSHGGPVFLDDLRVVGEP